MNDYLQPFKDGFFEGYCECIRQALNLIQIRKITDVNRLLDALARCAKPKGSENCADVVFAHLWPDRIKWVDGWRDSDAESKYMKYQLAGELDGSKT